MSKKHLVNLILKNILMNMQRNLIINFFCVADSERFSRDIYTLRGEQCNAMQTERQKFYANINILFANYDSFPVDPS